MASVYQINKGVGRPIMFRGLKAQYIAYLAVGLVFLLIGFAVLYICGVSLVVILPIILSSGTGLFVSVNSLSRRFGEFGLMKHFARRNLPTYLRFSSRQLFLSLCKPKLNHN